MGNTKITEAQEALRIALKELDYARKAYSVASNASGGMAYPQNQERYKAAQNEVVSARENLSRAQNAEFQEQKEYIFQANPATKQSYEKFVASKKRHSTVVNNLKEVGKLLSETHQEYKSLRNTQINATGSFKESNDNSLIKELESDDAIKEELRNVYLLHGEAKESESQALTELKLCESELYNEIKKVTTKKEKKVLSLLLEARELFVEINRDYSCGGSLIGKPISSPVAKVSELNVLIKDLAGR